MNFLKSAIIILSLLICTLTGYMFINFDEQYEINKIEELFLKEDYEASEQQLFKLRSAVQKKEFHLYLSYIRREQGRLEEAQKEMENVVSLIRHHRPTPFVLETYLNACLNAYLLGDKRNFSIYLSKLDKEFPTDPWVMFFRGLDDQLQGKHQEALEEWKGPAPLRIHLSPWMKKGFKDVIDPSWEKMLMARSEIETGEFFEARQSLEKISKNASDSLIPEINFLLALSYFKEASEKANSSGIPYYKLAFNYFNRSTIHQRNYREEKEKIINTLGEISFHLIEKKDYRNLTFFSNALKNWEATGLTEQISEKIIKALDQEIAGKNIPNIRSLSGALNQLITDPQERDHLSFQFFKKFESKIDSEEIFVTKSYWELTQTFSSDITHFSTKISQASRKKAIKELQRDREDLQKSVGYIQLWAMIETSSEKKLSFSKEIIDLAYPLWLGDQGKKALKISEIALQLTPKQSREEMVSYIERNMNRLYEKAMEEKKIDKLPFLMECAYSLELKNINFKDKKSISNHLKEAQRLYREKNYSAAMKRVNWLIHLDIENSDAHLLSGKINYEQGFYGEAHRNFEKLSKVSLELEELEEKVLLSRYISTGGKAGLMKVEQSMQQGKISDDGIIRIIVSELMKNKPLMALKWLKGIEKKTDELTVFECFACYKAEKWSDALAAFDRLNPKFKEIDAMQGVQVISLSQSEKGEKAEQLLKELLEEADDEKPITSSSQSFKMFQENFLNLFNRYFVAGKFYHEIKKDTKTALAYFQKLEDPTSRQRIARAEILKQLKLFEDAREDLEFVLNRGEISKFKSSQLSLAKVYRYLGQYPESVLAFKEYSQIAPLDSSYLSTYVNVLMKVQRYEDALEQLVKIRKNEDFSSFEDKVAYLECLIRMNRPDEAIEQTYIWLSEEPPPERIQQITFARVMTSIEAPQIIYPLFEKLSQLEEEISDEEKARLVDLLVQLGAFGKAKEIAADIEPYLEKSEWGALLLARMKESLSEKEEAKRFAKIALEMNPHSIEGINLVDRNETDLDKLQDSAGEIRKKIKNGKASPSEKLLYVRRIELIAVKKRLKEEELSPRVLGELKDCYYILDKLQKNGYSFPEVYYLMGQTMYHLEKHDQALKAFEKAVAIDPSYSAAHRSIALLSKEKQSGHLESIDMLKIAQKYSPNDFDTWFLLAHFYILSDDYYEAKKALLKAIQFQPNNLNPYLSLGKILKELKNPEDAWIAFEKVLELDPENEVGIKGVLSCLYDKNFRISKENAKKLRIRKNEAFKLLQAINPDEANTFLQSLTDPKDESEKS